MEDIDNRPIPPAPVSTRIGSMRAMQDYIETINEDKEISIIEILRLSGAFHLDEDSRYRENGFGNRTFKECFPSEVYFIAWLRYDGITADKKNILRRKYYDFIDQQNALIEQPNNNEQQNNQRGGKRKRNKRSNKRNETRRNKTRINKTRRNKTRRNKTRRRYTKHCL